MLGIVYPMWVPAICNLRLGFVFHCLASGFLEVVTTRKLKLGNRIETTHPAWTRRLSTTALRPDATQLRTGVCLQRHCGPDALHCCAMFETPDRDSTIPGRQAGQPGNLSNPHANMSQEFHISRNGMSISCYAYGVPKTRIAKPSSENHRDVHQRWPASFPVLRQIGMTKCGL